MPTLLLLLMLHGFFLAAVLVVWGLRRESADHLPSDHLPSHHVPSHREGATLVLAGLMLVVSLLLLEGWLGRSGWLERWPALRGALRPAWFLIGPLALVYVQRFLGRPAARRELLGAFTPAVGVALWMMPFYLASPSVRASGYQSPGGTGGTLAIYFLFSLLTAWCALGARRAIREAQQAADDPRLQEAPWRLAWVRWLMGMLVAYALLDFVASALFMLRGGYPSWVGAASLLILTSIVYSTGVLVVLPDGLLARAPWPGKRYARSELPSDWVAVRTKRLERLMSDERPWLDETLSLDQLAAKVGVSRHVLSQILNEHLGMSFNDYVNGYRIAEAQRLLLDMGSRRSMLDIGLEAGFGSNATFYRAFKKHVGSTPSEFLAQTAAGGVAGMQDRRRGSGPAGG